MIKLNKEQTEAADFKTGIAIVISIPGAGKTLTMTTRIARLVNNGVEPEKILGLTFTRNAAEAMRAKLEPLLDERAKRVLLMTIHSFCLYLLKRESKVFEILSGKEQIVFVNTILKKIKIKNISVGMALREISLAKNNIISVQEFRTLYEGDKTYQKVADVFEGYESEKEKRMLYDLDDLLLKTYYLLLDNSEVREFYRESFQHILLDETQDTNVLQMEILKLLIGEANGETSFWCCGDDWQSIYSFIGANVNNILDFNKLYPDSKQFILNLNYRSTPQILTGCQNLIKHNERKIEKELKTNNKDGDDIIVLESSSEEGEALSVVNEIKELIEDGYKYKDISVIYRANFQSRLIEEHFSRQKIPYHIENGLNFYQRKEVKVLLDYLRVIDNPLSDEGNDALVSCINTPNRYIGRKFITELENYASDKELYLYESLKSMPIKLPYVRKNVKEFTQFLNPLIEDSKILQPAEVIQIIRETLNYDTFITDEDIASPFESKIDNINQIQLAAAKYSSMESFLQYTDSIGDVTSTDKAGVSLLTAHKAKGLEFPVVFVIGIVEGIMPSKQGNIEEERRVCFVAISRAMKLLYLSHTLSYLGVPSKKSTFINEILGKE